MPRIVLALAGLLVLAPVRADDTPRASMPYSKLVEYVKRGDELKDLDRLEVSSRIGSGDPRVEPSQIRLEATLKSGQVVAIPIAANGAFTLPSSPELVQEDPMLVSNQPVGTMRLNIVFTVKRPVARIQRYAELMEGVVQLEMAAKRAGLKEARTPRGLLFSFTEGGHTLKFHTSKGTQVIRSEAIRQARKHFKEIPLGGTDGTSFLYVEMNQRWLRENPETEFDALPIAVIPAL